MVQLIDVLTFSSPIILFLGTIVGFIAGGLPVRLRLLHVYLISALVVDLLSRIPQLRFYESNLILLPVFHGIEITLFTLIYRDFFQGKLRSLVTILGAVIAFGYLLAACGAFVGEFETLNLFAVHASSIGVLVFCFLYLFDRFRAAELPDPLYFRLNGVFLFYFATKLVFYIPVVFYIWANSELKFYFWLFYLLVTFGFYLYLTLLLWRFGRTVK